MLKLRCEILFKILRKGFPGTYSSAEINLSELEWRDSRAVRCVVDTPIIESSIPCLREAVYVRMSSYLTIASG